MRKALMAEQGKHEMQINIADVEAACRDQDIENKKLQENIEKIIRKDAETSKREEKAQRDQVQYL